MIVVTGATGNVGRPLVEQLLAAGHPVRAVARNAAKLDELARQGAETVTADLTDAPAITRAFTGAQAVFTVLPVAPDAPDVRAAQRAIIETYATAIGQAGVSHVVTLSSVGAHLERGAGPISGLYEYERRLNGLADVAVLHLRGAFFMENFFGVIEPIKSFGVLGFPLRPDLSFAMIATRDIARVAAERLAARDFTGSSALELLGPRHLTMTEAAGILGKAIDRPDLPYVQFPYEDAAQAMIAGGLSEDVANAVVEMNRGFNDGLIEPTQPRSEATTTPTSLEEFSQVFAEVFSRS